MIEVGFGEPGQVGERWSVFSNRWDGPETPANHIYIVPTGSRRCYKRRWPPPVGSFGLVYFCGALESSSQRGRVAIFRLDFGEVLSFVGRRGS